MECIPKEFILGYYAMKMDTNKFDFKENPNFYPYIEGFDKEFVKVLEENHVMDLQTATERLALLKSFPEGLRDEYFDNLIAYIEARLNAQKELK